jgi:hypothetical protein
MNVFWLVEARRRRARPGWKLYATHSTHQRQVCSFYSFSPPKGEHQADILYVHFNMHPLVDLNGGTCVQEGRTLAAEIEQMKKMIVPADKKAGAGASPYKVFLQKPNSWNEQFSLKFLGTILRVLRL